MKRIDFLCDVICKGKNPEMKILKRFIADDGWFIITDLLGNGSFNYYVLKRLIDELDEREILIAEKNSWITGTNIKAKGKAITKGKKWKINNKSKFVKWLKGEM